MENQPQFDIDIDIDRHRQRETETDQCPLVTAKYPPLPLAPSRRYLIKLKVVYDDILAKTMASKLT